MGVFLFYPDLRAERPRTGQVRGRGVEEARERGRAQQDKARVQRGVPPEREARPPLFRRIDQAASGGGG